MVRKRAGSNATHPTGRNRFTDPSGAPDRLSELLRIEPRNPGRAAREILWSQAGSNRRPPACKAGALPTELWPHHVGGAAEASSFSRRGRPVVGLGGLEPPTSPLSGVRSNQLSYRPELVSFDSCFDQAVCAGARRRRQFHFGKEVIQPQVPLRLPCYDFTPVINHTVVTALPKVKQATSGAANSHGVTGGVYKARERIHRSVLICDY